MLDAPRPTYPALIVRPLRPALVVTVSLSVVGCAAPAPPTEARAATPTPASTATSPPAPATTATTPLTAAATTTAAPLATATKTGFQRHPRDAAGRVIYLRKAGGCFVEVVESPAERRIRFDDTACAPVMSDPAYQACDNGEIRLANDGCVCARLGNPPRPPFGVACPPQ